MSLTEFLSNCTPEELTERLLMLDKSIMELHQNGYYVVSNLLDIAVNDGQITLASFKDKVDYLNSGYNDNGDKKDILNVAAFQFTEEEEKTLTDGIYINGKEMYISFVEDFTI